MRLSRGGREEVTFNLTTGVLAQGNDAITEAGQAFYGGARRNSTTSRYSSVQVFNPADSGVIVYVDYIIVSHQATTNINIGIHNTALTGDQGAGQNKQNGGAAAACHIRTEAATSVIGTVQYVPVTLGYLVQSIPFEHPFQLGEAEGFIVSNSGVSNFMAAHFFWREYTT